MPTLTKCTKCGYVSSQEICKACILLEGLNKGLPRLGIGKTSRINKVLNRNILKEDCLRGSKLNCHSKLTCKTNHTCNCQKLVEIKPSVEVTKILQKIEL